MKEKNLTIDINKLNDTELESLAAMFYRLGKMNETKQINKRIAFLRGWSENEE